MLHSNMFCTSVDMLKKAADEVGPDKVIAVTTDSASVMIAGKNDLIQLDGYQHILPLP
jgi:hypothetical protein